MFTHLFINRSFGTLLAIFMAINGALFNLSCATKKYNTASGLSESTEKQIDAESVKAYEDVKKKAKRSKDARLTAMVEKVSMRIAKASGYDFDWEVILIEENQPNAWCMPGGKMAVYTGILPILKTEGALAAVMGHEVAHATQKHGHQGYAKAISDQKKMLVLGILGIGASQFLCKTKTCKILAAGGIALAAFTAAFFSRKFSRGNETEADQVGQIYMAKAGYEPAESIKVWERMEAASGGKSPPEFMSTHPSNANRRAKLRSWLPEAKKEYSKADHHYGIGASI